VLLTAITSRWDRCLWIDTGDEVNLPNAHIAFTARDAIKALPGRVVWRPSWQELRPGGTGGTSVVRPELVDQVLRRVWELGHCGVGLHELGDVADQNSVPIMLGAIWRKGRKKAIPIVAATQAPVGIPRVARREASHIFCFALHDPEDRDTVASFTGPQIRDEPLPFPFDFTCWHRGPDGIVHKMPSISVPAIA